MHQYLIKIPWIVKLLFPNYIWSIPTSEKEVFLTFDDGPHPIITPWVLDQLKKYEAGATFFCIGKNVQQYPKVYQQILDEGHRVGNHTHNHMNGWKFSDQEYVNDIMIAKKFIQSDLFRPPYGRIKKSQVNLLRKRGGADFKIVMWDVLSADFDRGYSEEQCVKNVIKNVSKGSVIVFHDSEKAYDNLAYALPIVLEHLKKEGYVFNTLR
jgi:peptidoglycan/xylan/chitin deacetylase (PgdA/CDA1 family)